MNLHFCPSVHVTFLLLHQSISMKFYIFVLFKFSLQAQIKMLQKGAFTLFVAIPPSCLLPGSQPYFAYFFSFNYLCPGHFFPPLYQSLSYFLSNLRWRLNVLSYVISQCSLPSFFYSFCNFFLYLIVL